MSVHFQFLKAEWSKLYEAAAKAESLVYSDPRTACFYSRRALENAVTWLFECEPASPHPTKPISQPSYLSQASKP